MGALSKKYFSDVSKLSKSDLSLYVRDVVKRIPDMLILDVSVPHIVYCNSQNFTNTAMEKDIERGEEGVA